MLIVQLLQLRPEDRLRLMEVPQQEWIAMHHA
jgi:hypothetical protein